MFSNPAGVWSYHKQPGNAVTGTYNPAAAALISSPGMDGQLAFCANSSSVSLNTSESYY